jgi:hypothetical protein
LGGDVAGGVEGGVLEHAPGVETPAALGGLARAAARMMAAAATERPQRREHDNKRDESSKTSCHHPSLAFGARHEALLM